MHQIGRLSPLDWVQSIKTLFLNCNFLSARDLACDQTELHSFTLSILFALEVVVVGDQLPYFKAPFYNSNCSKPNGSASPFGEAQFDNAKPCSAMALGS